MHVINYNIKKSFLIKCIDYCGFALVCDITKIIKVAKTCIIMVQYIQIV